MAKDEKKSEAADPGVASERENAKLQHTDDLRDQADAGPRPRTEDNVPEGHSATTRHDAHDLGVPMLPGSPDEPQGPEDALGSGPKRGDYRDRLGGDSYQPHQGAEPQRPRAEEIGDAEGLKGGVETS